MSLLWGKVTMGLYEGAQEVLALADYWYYSSSVP